MRGKKKVVQISTDILIIGGGLAGCMAAIRASEQAIKITIAEKANTATSGCAGAGIDHIWCYIPPVHEKMGWAIEDLMEDHKLGICGGLVNEELLYLVASQAYERVLDLEKLGINFRYGDSPLPEKFRIVPQFHSIPDALNFDGRDIKLKLTRELKRRGIDVVNRVMITDLITTEGQISGALGIGTRTGEAYVFRTKAAVLCTGRVSRLSRSVTGIWGNASSPLSETGDGRAMALNAGLEVVNMEFFPPPGPYAIGNYEANLGAPRNTLQPAGCITNHEGEVIVPRTYFYDWTKSMKERVDAEETRRKWLEQRKQDKPNYARLHHQGKGPFYLDLTKGSQAEIHYIEWSIENEGRGYRFLDYLKRHEQFDFKRDKIEFLPTTRGMASSASSGLIVDGNLETNISGLFAAGDDVGGVPWKSAPGALTMGWRAGEMAAKSALERKEFAPIDKNTVELFEGHVRLMLGRNGNHWREIELALQNIMDHYCGDVRTEALLKRGIERLRDIQESLVFAAADAHELMRCMEVRSLMTNADVILRASLERRETRKLPLFKRVDYPEQDDENWLAFLALKREGEDFHFRKIFPH